jgi:hypothetical protein
MICMDVKNAKTAGFESYRRDRRVPEPDDFLDQVASPVILAK